MDWPLSLTLSGMVLQKKQKPKRGYSWTPFKFEYANDKKPLKHAPCYVCYIPCVTFAFWFSRSSLDRLSVIIGRCANNSIDPAFRTMIIYS